LAVAGWDGPEMLHRYTWAMQQEEQAVETFRDFDPFG